MPICAGISLKVPTVARPPLYLNPRNMPSASSCQLRDQVRAHCRFCSGAAQLPGCAVQLLGRSQGRRRSFAGGRKLPKTGTSSPCQVVLFWEGSVSFYWNNFVRGFEAALFFVFSLAGGFGKPNSDITVRANPSAQNVWFAFGPKNGTPKDGVSQQLLDPQFYCLVCLKPSETVFAPDIELACLSLSCSLNRTSLVIAIKSRRIVCSQRPPQPLPVYISPAAVVSKAFPYLCRSKVGAFGRARCSGPGNLREREGRKLPKVSQGTRTLPQDSRGNARNPRWMAAPFPMNQLNGPSHLCKRAKPG